jgi:pectinesterase
MKKNRCVAIAATIFAGICPLRADVATPLPAHKIKIVLVGDSTVTDKSGWGLGFKQFLNDRAECINTAHGGESSLSFMRAGRWTNALALKGDYYLIQFGHNNQPGKPGRSTDMATYIANLEQYVDDARAIGAHPVLVTPLTRREWDKKHPGKIKSSLAPYAVDVRKVAAEKHVPIVDLQARSIELCESLGPEKCLEFSPLKTERGEVRHDGTHLNAMGSVLFARLVVDELRKAVPTLDSVLLAEPPPDDPVLQNPVVDAVVSHDSTEQDGNLRAAIHLAPNNSDKPYKILIEPGIYPGQFMVPTGKNHIEFIGVDPTNTILTYPFNVHEAPPGETYQFNPGLVVAGNDFKAENLTIQNMSGDHGQALALRVDGDRECFKNCRITGWQDTLMINNGRDYFTNCYIAGRVDFIYGSATAVFDHCEIHSRNGGHVTAASTPQDQPYGFVFLNCKLTGDSQPWISPEGVPANKREHPMADLGRPWRPYASVAFINCWMGDHIAPAGWNNWGKIANETTARYSEYGSTGPGANPAARVKWARQLTEEQARAYTVANILHGDDSWNPTQPVQIPEANRMAPSINATSAELDRTLPMLFIVGDSTVHNSAPGLLGWGDVLGSFFDPKKIIVENHAQPGRSSRTFQTQGWWAPILSAARPGDFVIIQMGDNDGGALDDASRARGTIPGIGDQSQEIYNPVQHRQEVVHTYGWYMRKYIVDARAKGMTPVICSPVPQLPQHTVKADDMDKTAYVKWSEEVARQEHVVFIPLNHLVLMQYVGMTPQQIKAKYFTTHDNTHTCPAGARLNASEVVAGLRELKDSPLKADLLHP